MRRACLPAAAKTSVRWRSDGGREETPYDLVTGRSGRAGSRITQRPSLPPYDRRNIGEEEDVADVDARPNPDRFETA